MTPPSLALALLLLLLRPSSPVAAAAAPPHWLKTIDDAAAADGRRGNCTGYLVQGAGDAAVNGCYKQVGELCGQGRPGFVLDKTHQLYSWDGVWKLGLCGKGPVNYAAVH